VLAEILEELRVGPWGRTGTPEPEVEEPEPGVAEPEPGVEEPKPSS
jgi:hypothetical protein